jgi:hypothetical protein
MRTNLNFYSKKPQYDPFSIDKIFTNRIKQKSDLH